MVPVVEREKTLREKVIDALIDMKGVNIRNISEIEPEKFVESMNHNLQSVLKKKGIILDTEQDVLANPAEVTEIKVSTGNIYKIPSNILRGELSERIGMPYCFSNRELIYTQEVNPTKSDIVIIKIKYI